MGSPRSNFKQAQEINERAERRHKRALREHRAVVRDCEAVALAYRDLLEGRVADALTRFEAVFSRFQEVQMHQAATRVSSGKASDGKVTLNDIETGLLGTTAVGVIGGGGLGGVAAGATWLGVGAWGTASTGTAITTLNGVAASNAALAYLGGGSLAAGGGGMAAGTLVLSGIGAVPVVVVGGLVWHRKSKTALANARTNEHKINAAVRKLSVDMSRFLKDVARLERLDAVCEALASALEQGIANLEEWSTEYDRLADLPGSAQTEAAVAAKVADTLLRVASTPIGHGANREAQAANAQVKGAETLLCGMGER